MAEIADYALWFNGHSLRPYTNSAALNVTVEPKDATVYGSDGHMTHAAGLSTADVNFEGLVDDAATIEGTLNTSLRHRPNISVVVPRASSPDIVYFSDPSPATEFSESASIGELFGFAYAAMMDGAIRGYAVLNGTPVASPSRVSVPTVADANAYVVVHTTRELAGVTLRNYASATGGSPIATADLSTLAANTSYMAEVTGATGRYWSITAPTNATPDSHAVIGVGWRKE